jgi:FkbM family methyltransferase
MGTGDGKLLARNLGSLARETALSLMINEGATEVVFTRDGHRWHTDLGDGIGASLWMNGAHDEEAISDLVDWLSRSGRTGTVVVDVGANVGTTTIPLARSGFQLLAVEPVPRTAAMLRENLAAHGFSSEVAVVECAIHATLQSVQIWTGFGSGQAEVATPGHEPSITRFGGDKGDLIPVPAAGLSQLLKNEGLHPEDVAIVWSDTQGSESEVIESGRDLWSRGVPLYLEVDPLSLEAHGGVDRFLRLAEASFDTFLPKEDIRRRDDPRPIESLAKWVAELPNLRYEDALLLPTPGRSK